MNKTIHIHYYAVLREERGMAQEKVSTSAKTALELYDQLQKQHGFKLSTDILKVAINNEFTDWNSPLKTEDTVVFIPPVAGG